MLYFTLVLYAPSRTSVRGGPDMQKYTAKKRVMNMAESQDGQGWVYSEKVKDHFFNPRNIMTEDEETYAADGVGEVGSMSCGDMMKVWIKVDKENDTIADCKWKTFGCASAIGSTSMLSTMVVGMKLDEAMRLTPQDIINELDGLPDQKIHCSVLGDKALRAAVEEYFRKSGQEDRIDARRKEDILCECLAVTRGEIEEAVEHGAKTFEAVQERTKCGTECGGCEEDITQLVAELVVQYYGD